MIRSGNLDEDESRVKREGISTAPASNSGIMMGLDDERLQPISRREEMAHVGSRSTIHQGAAFLQCEQEKLQTTRLHQHLTINATDVLCGKGKTSFNHGKIYAAACLSVLP